MAEITHKVYPVLAIRIDQKRQFTRRTCLPMMCRLAGNESALVEELVRDDHADWPLEDQILVRLHPDLETAATAFHNGIGEPLIKLQSKRELQRLDEKLHRTLETLVRYLKSDRRNEP